MNQHHGVHVIVCALFLGAFTANGLAADAARPGAQERGDHLVRIPARALDQVRGLGVNPRLSLDYGTFVWEELSTADLARLRAAGVAFEEQVDPFTLRLGGQSFDPAQRARQLPPGWDVVRPGGRRLHLVQFVGPTQAEWLDVLAENGLEIVQYIHPFTYVVYGDTQALQAAADNDFVRWTGPFAPAYRVLPRWRNLFDDSREVQVLMYAGAAVDAGVQEFEGLGGQLDNITTLGKSFKLARLNVPGSRFQAMAQVPGVYSIQPVPTDGGLRSEMSDQVCVNNVDGGNIAFPGYPAWLTSVGLDGSGVIIANVDGGIQNSHPDLVNRLIACTGQTCGGSASSGHGTHTAGIMAADGSSGVTDSYGFLRGLGIAPGASLVEQTYAGWYPQPDGMLLLMSDSYNNGAYLSGNSWGPSNNPLGYDNHTMQVDIGSRDTDDTTPGDQGLLYVLSIMNGNGGTSSQGTPDEAKNIFTIGSTKMQNSNGSQIPDIDDISANSAHGPCLDGRKIPHMVAPGCRVDSSYTGSGYSLLCGTSMASPHVAGAAALFVEYYRNLPGFGLEPSVALTKAAFLPVAHDLAGNRDANNGTLGHPFDSKQGWGRMDLEAVVDPQVEVRYYDNPMIFDNTGEEWVEAISAADSNEPVRIMLVWTDAPGHGLGGSTPAWNNDLDLQVESLTDTYLGNQFDANGWSVPGGTADDRNNTEGVFIGPTASGVYTIRVTASNISSDGLPNSGDGTDQDFSLVCYNCGPGGPQPPTAHDVAASTPVSTPVTVVLDAIDDGLPEPAELSFIITALPEYGALSDPSNGPIETVPHALAGNGNQVGYAPVVDYSGPDAFQFVASDGGVPPEGGESNVATAFITVGGPEWDPVAVNVTDSTPLSTQVDVELAGSDPNGDALTFIVESLPVNGSLSDPGAGLIETVPHVLAGGGNIVTYMPIPDTYLLEMFDFSVRDATAGSNTATVALTVGGPLWDPVASDMQWGTAVSLPTEIALSASDPNGDPLTYTIESLPDAGGLSDPGAGVIGSAPYTLVGGGGVVTFTPPFGQTVQTAFDFSVRDATAGSNVATVTVDVGAPHAVYSFLMDSDPAWGTTGQWAFGQPTGQGSRNPDPTSGKTGNNVYGYNLEGDYENNMPLRYLTTGPIDCTHVANAELRFWRWLGIESSFFDEANMQISTNGLMWTTLWEHDGAAIGETSWSLHTFDISAIADSKPAVYFRWGMGPTDGLVAYSGWNLDDILIWGLDTTPVPLPCDDVTFTPGDVNLDGGVNGADVQTLVQMLLNPVGAWSPEQLCAGDFTQDDAVTLADVDAFVLELLN